MWIDKNIEYMIEADTKITVSDYISKSAALTDGWCF